MATAILDKEGSRLIVSWEEDGLGKNINVDYQASAEGTALYVCVNAGGRCSRKDERRTVVLPVTNGITLSSGDNGQIIGALVLMPPDDGKFVCSDGQVMTLAEIGYLNIIIEDVTNGISAAAVPDTISSVLFTCP